MLEMKPTHRSLRARERLIDLRDGFKRMAGGAEFIGAIHPREETTLILDGRTLDDNKAGQWGLHEVEPGHSSQAPAAWYCSICERVTACMSWPSRHDRCHCSVFSSAVRSLQRGRQPSLDLALLLSSFR